ncbi:hypothetical protein F5I97DRAFT_1810590 [Phlebopus sp. FC_14]|nr:hypothetical protein F5I97DRAFT_1810590 [Phlebopus sp. FC_14]
MNYASKYDISLVSLFSCSCRKKGSPYKIVSDTSTCRHHLAFCHKAAYLKWCKENKFVSMLSEDVKECKIASDITNVKQGSMNDHVREIVPTEHVIPYSDALFREAAVEWLITTNQVCLSLYYVLVTHRISVHPSFKKMVDIASRATKGVIIPNRNATCREIMKLFKKQMAYLLNVSVSFCSNGFN